MKLPNTPTLIIAKTRKPGRPEPGTQRFQQNWLILFLNCQAPERTPLHLNLVRRYPFAFGIQPVAILLEWYLEMDDVYVQPTCSELINNSPRVRFIQ